MDRADRWLFGWILFFILLFIGMYYGTSSSMPKKSLPKDNVFDVAVGGLDVTTYISCNYSIVCFSRGQSMFCFDKLLDNLARDYCNNSKLFK